MKLRHWPILVGTTVLFLVGAAGCETQDAAENPASQAADAGTASDTGEASSDAEEVDEDAVTEVQEPDGEIFDMSNCSGEEWDEPPCPVPGFVGISTAGQTRKIERSIRLT